MGAGLLRFIKHSSAGCGQFSPGLLLPRHVPSGFCVSCFRWEGLAFSAACFSSRSSSTREEVWALPLRRGVEPCTRSSAAPRLSQREALHPLVLGTRLPPGKVRRPGLVPALRCPGASWWRMALGALGAVPLLCSWALSCTRSGVPRTRLCLSAPPFCGQVPELPRTTAAPPQGLCSLWPRPRWASFPSQMCTQKGSRSEVALPSAAPLLASAGPPRASTVSGERPRALRAI